MEKTSDITQGTRKRHLYAVAAIACAAMMYLTGAYWGCGEYPAGPSEQADVASGDATAAGPCGNKRKDNLANIWHGNVNTIFGDYRLFSYTVYTDWGYRPNNSACSQPGVIRWRHSELQFIPRASVGDVHVANARWFATSCYDSGRQCMTRRDVGVQWSVGIKGVTFNGYVDGCITTRIGPGGNHWRHVYDKQDCASVVGRALTRSNRTPARKSVKAVTAARQAYRNWDRAQATIEDFVDRRTAARVEHLCSTKGLGSPRCRQTLWHAYTALSPKMQRRAESAMARSAATK